jgi:hypothetical protein
MAYQIGSPCKAGWALVRTRGLFWAKSGPPAIRASAMSDKKAPKIVFLIKFLQSKVLMKEIYREANLDLPTRWQNASGLLVGISIIKI